MNKIIKQIVGGLLVFGSLANANEYEALHFLDSDKSSESKCHTKKTERRGFFTSKVDLRVWTIFKTDKGALLEVELIVVDIENEDLKVNFFPLEDESGEFLDCSLKRVSSDVYLDGRYEITLEGRNGLRFEATILVQEDLRGLKKVSEFKTDVRHTGRFKDSRGDQIDNGKWSNVESFRGRIQKAYADEFYRNGFTPAFSNN